MLHSMAGMRSPDRGSTQNCRSNFEQRLRWPRRGEAQGWAE